MVSFVGENERRLKKFIREQEEQEEQEQEQE
jgi:hypothetical protein